MKRALPALALVACGVRTEPEAPPPLPPFDVVVSEAASDARVGCRADLECDNQRFCDGVERCLEGACVPGAPVLCATTDPCLPRSCDERARGCVATVSPADGDGDGFVGLYAVRSASGELQCGVDCDDRNPAVHPGARELCNGVDDDCNGATDEGARYELTGLDLQISTPTQRAILGASMANTGRELALVWNGYEGPSPRMWGGTLTAAHAMGVPAHQLSDANLGAFGRLLQWDRDHATLLWTDTRDTDYEVYFQHFDAQVTPLGSPQRLSVARGLSIAGSSQPRGDYDIVVWRDQRQAFLFRDVQYDLYAQRVERSTGLQVGDNVLMTTGPQTFRSAPVLAPQGVRGAPGVPLSLLWLDSQDMPDNRLYAVWYAHVSEGLTLQGSRRLTPLGVAAGQHNLAWLRDRWLVLYTLLASPDIADGRVWAQMLTADGEALTAPLALTPAEHHVRVWAWQPLGDRFVLAWTARPEGQTRYTIYAQTFDAGLTPRGSVLTVTSSPGDTEVSDLEATPDGSLGALYRDHRTGDWLLHYTRLRCALP